MDGADIRELIKRYDANPNYSCLIESLVDHKLSYDDPLTSTILKRAQGIGYALWPVFGDWWRLAITVEWEKGLCCNYIETYRRKNKVRKPITEIKFVRELYSDLLLPERNPLVVHPNRDTVKNYFRNVDKTNL